jgi:hypothetical protein
MTTKSGPNWSDFPPAAGMMPQAPAFKPFQPGPQISLHGGQQLDVVINKQDFWVHNGRDSSVIIS